MQYPAPASLPLQGYAVTLLDKDPDLGLGASSLNAGWHRTQSHAPLTSPGTVKSVIKSLGVSEGESVLLVWPSYFLRDPEWMRFGARFMGAVMSSAMRAFFSDYCLHLSKFSADLLVEVQAPGTRGARRSRLGCAWIPGNHQLAFTGRGGVLARQASFFDHSPPVPVFAPPPPLTKQSGVPSRRV